MKIEMHAHTSEVSPCSAVKAADMIKVYRAAGYDAVAVTNHYNSYVLEGFNISDDIKRVKKYLCGFELASEEGKKQGITAIFGVEVCLRNYGFEDYLLYGIKPKTLYENPFLYDYSLKQLRDVCDKDGILLFQAHPFRENLKRANVSMLDGIEGYNGNPRHNSHNDLALAWAKENHKRVSSGSDFHHMEDLARGGIETPFTAVDENSLKEILLSGNYSMIMR